MKCNSEATGNAPVFVAFPLHLASSVNAVQLDRRATVALIMTVTLLGLAGHALAPDHPTVRRLEPAPAARSDLLGNDVTPAVATYKLDTTGVLYEEHSPQTELPQLGEPRS